MSRPDLSAVIESIVSQPTAPFHEYHVKAKIVERLENCPHVSLLNDGFGNLIAHYHYGDNEAHWAFGSHMDHPGWVKRPPDAPPLPDDQAYLDRGEYRFLGGVPAPFFETQAPIEEFGDFAMWKLPAFELTGDNRVVSRACDDLVGCAAIVAAMEEMSREGIEASCYGIFTRAEEVGFVGACELARNWPLAEDVVFCSIETSVAASRSAMGNGPICRVGDRLSIFDSEATASMLAAAKNRRLRVQRALLDRGSCEATALQTYGIKTAGISVPLGNYHNCAPENQIDAEYVSLADIDTLVNLMIAMASEFPPHDDTAEQDLRESFDNRSHRYKEFAEASAEHFSASTATA
ncbi:MAG: hypothetical protein AAGA58_20130 [Verrucomicrobiota bacterium]